MRGAEQNQKMDDITGLLRLSGRVWKDAGRRAPDPRRRKKRFRKNGQSGTRGCSGDAKGNASKMLLQNPPGSQHPFQRTSRPPAPYGRRDASQRDLIGLGQKKMDKTDIYLLGIQVGVFVCHLTEKAFQPVGQPLADLHPTQPGLMGKPAKAVGLGLV